MGHTAAMSEINGEFAAALAGIGSARHRPWAWHIMSYMCWHRKASRGDVIVFDQNTKKSGSKKEDERDV